MRHWSTEEIELLRALDEEGKSIAAIAEATGRTIRAVERQRQRVRKGDTINRAIKWTPERREHIRRLWNENKSAAQIAAEMGCTVKAVWQIRSVLDLPMRGKGWHRPHPDEARIIAALQQRQPQSRIDFLPIVRSVWRLDTTLRRLERKRLIVPDRRGRGVRKNYVLADSREAFE